MSPRAFSVPRDDRADVPAVLWEPAYDGDGATPLVLLGHGGRSHKTGERNQRLAERLVDHGFRVLAIDGPFHGDRPPPDGLGYQEATAAEGPRPVMGRMVTDWLAALTVVREERPVSRLGYLGLSMGARHGLGLAAALDRELDCAVLGKYGLEQTGVLHPGLDDAELTLELAARVRCAVLFHLEARDEIFPHTGQRALFEALGASDRVLRVRDGDHGSARPEDESAWIDFLVAHLDPGRPGTAPPAAPR